MTRSARSVLLVLTLERQPDVAATVRHGSSADE